MRMPSSTHTVGIMPKRTKRVSAMLGSASVLKGGPSLSIDWRDGDEKPEPMGFTGDKEDALVDGPSGVEPRLRNFIALPLAGVRKALELELLWPWEAEKPMPGVKTGPEGFMPPFCCWRKRVSNGPRWKWYEMREEWYEMEVSWDKEGMIWKRYKKKKM
jgi:hypothetical protein